MGKKKIPGEGGTKPGSKKPVKKTSVDEEAGTATIHGARGAIPCEADESPSQDEQETD